MSQIPPIDPNNPYAVNTASEYGVRPQYGPDEGDATGGIIPYKNPQALIAYYLGLFSLFPCLGLALAIPAFILGILGLRARKRNPAIRGSVHAWIGIVMGGLMTVIWGLMAIAVIIGIATQEKW